MRRNVSAQKSSPTVLPTPKPSASPQLLPCPTVQTSTLPHTPTLNPHFLSHYYPQQRSLANRISATLPCHKIASMEASHRIPVSLRYELSRLLHLSSPSSSTTSECSLHCPITTPLSRASYFTLAYKSTPHHNPTLCIDLLQCSFMQPSNPAICCRLYGLT